MSLQFVLVGDFFVFACISLSDVSDNAHLLGDPDFALALRNQRDYGETFEVEKGNLSGQLVFHTSPYIYNLHIPYIAFNICSIKSYFQPSK